MPLLALEHLSVSYGPVRAVRGLTLSVEQGELVTLLGSNGAGKTSTLHAIMGMAPVVGGRVLFDGKDLHRQSTERIVRQRMTLVPEGRHVFPRLTVFENLVLGASGRSQGNRQTGFDNGMQALFDLFPILAERRGQLAGTLSGGEQQMLAIARALMAEPRLLLMDEPSLGLAPQFIEKIFDLIAELHRRGVTILLVEQNVRMALEIASRGYVLATGELHLSGTTQELLASPAIEQAYLGVRQPAQEG